MKQFTISALFLISIVAMAYAGNVEDKVFLGTKIDAATKNRLLKINEKQRQDNATSRAMSNKGTRRLRTSESGMFYICLYIYIHMFSRM